MTAREFLVVHTPANRCEIQLHLESCEAWMAATRSPSETVRLSAKIQPAKNSVKDFAVGLVIAAMNTRSNSMKVGYNVHRKRPPF